MNDRDRFLYIPGQPFTAAEALENFMSELSERISRATWDPANEEVIWGFAENPDEPYDDQGWGEITLEDRQRVAMLRDACGCWCVWDDDIGPYGGIRRVPVSEYRERIRGSRRMSETSDALHIRDAFIVLGSEPVRVGLAPSSLTHSHIYTLGNYVPRWARRPRLRRVRPLVRRARAAKALWRWTKGEPCARPH